MSAYSPPPASFPANVALTALRVVAAFIFITSGTTKIFAFPSALPPDTIAEPFNLIWVGGWLEMVLGTLIGIGLFTRFAAFLASGMMAVAYFKFHAPTDFWPTINHGGEAILFCFIWLYFAAVGAGPWSVDARRGGRR